VSSQNGSSLPTLSLEPTQKNKTHRQYWDVDIRVSNFCGVYTGKYPMEALALMKYGEVVRGLGCARGWLAILRHTIAQFTTNQSIWNALGFNSLGTLDTLCSQGVLSEVSLGYWMPMLQFSAQMF
jgi:hypothetical protein